MSWDSRELDRDRRRHGARPRRAPDRRLAVQVHHDVGRPRRRQPVRPLCLRARQRLVPPRHPDGRGRIRAGGVDRDVVLDHLAPDDPLHTEIDHSFHAKYDRYGPRIVGTVVGPDAAQGHPPAPARPTPPQP